MSYTPTNWQTGDTITAEKLNKMESGISANDTALTPFIVTLTPTAQDFSGTMDKTVAEIYAAYQSGKKIVFRILMGASVYMEVDCTARFANGGQVYPSFNAFIVTDSPSDMIICAWTGTTDDGTKNTYSTIIYPLTPMS